MFTSGHLRRFALYNRVISDPNRVALIGNAVRRRSVLFVIATVNLSHHQEHWIFLDPFRSVGQQNVFFPFPDDVLEDRQQIEVRCLENSDVVLG
jgi:hypothetical protein